MSQNNIKIIHPYDNKMPFVELTMQLETIREFYRSNEKFITDDMLISNRFTLLSNRSIFNEVIMK